MDRIKTMEIMVGLFVAAGLAALFVLAMKVSNLSSFTDEKDTYTLTARFDNIGGLKVRSPVSVAGVRIGRVAAIDFDNDTFEAVVRLAIARKYDHFPADTSAQIFTAGLLGEQYVGLEPGGEERVLKDGDEIRLTQSALVLEQIIGQFLYSKAQEGGK
ncbi:outer membrane lipid asymmetry maintenance protein MlaD [Thiohalobacter sp. IOR34]|uniref:outer membrane lipid asymmetry maintenance protein MlaD n=1 Tax=Thiohalobacter sp. IOR34 TaxID=3057176 RepID=UPI0025B266DE|nr:outer membrane lipid asymmetry maintenance protein MlaD [Thiohalobacter sp. IOR34]WJW74849.1 outer membrane lipid asymmetry maintenance protein MlaD [Thiohalobacter sp. IOR34]